MPSILPTRLAAAFGVSAWALASLALDDRSVAQDYLPPPFADRVEEISPLAKPDALPGPVDGGAEQELVVEIRVVGNETVPESQIVSNITTRAGRPFDRSVVQRDVRRLANLGWFVDVKPQYEQTSRGRIVIFRVVERPTIRYIDFLGNEQVSDKKLRKETGLKEGGSVDPYAVEEGRRKILEYYTSHGFNNAQVSIDEGARPSDQGVIYLINEGAKQRVKQVKFIGNEFVSGARLKTLIKSKKPILGLFKGYVDRQQIDADVEALTAYYRSYGFFQARIGRKIDYNADGTKAGLVFVISEGPRFTIRNVRFLGNTKFEPVPLQEAAKLAAGQPFEQGKMEQDAHWMQELYGSHGYVFADVRPETVFLEEPGQVDVVYHIEEGQRWRVGRIFVHIGGDNPHTRIQTALNRCTLRPGQIMDIRELHASERRLLASSLFHADQASGDRPKITYQIPDDVDLGLAERPRSKGEASGFRGQSPDSVGPPLLPPPSALDAQASPAAVAAHRPIIEFDAGVHASRPLPAIPTANGADVHVYCDDFAHYLRWVNSESGGSDSGNGAAMPQPGDGAEAPDLESGSRPRTPSRPQRSDELPGRGALQLARRTIRLAVRDSGRVALHATRRCAGDDREWSQAEAWQTPDTSPATPAPNPYNNLKFRGQSPGSPVADGGVIPAYSSISAATAAGYGGQAVRPTGPATAGVYGDSTVQPAQYSPNLQPPAGSVYPQPLNPYGPLPGYSVDPTSPMYVGPPGVPNYPEGTVDIFITGNETQTGRLMIGAGVNSNAGVVGNIVIDERNFDWTRYPTSWEDVRNGTAWRGDGQRFRVDASPGSQVSRYLVSWQQPYLLDRPVGLGLSGSYYTRRFRDWDEQRLGGRVALSYQWVDRDLSITGAYRGENVNISRPSSDISELTEVLGDNSLHGFGLTLINDTRDSPFLATQGHFFQLGGEQVIGSFDYPRVEADFRKYFLLHERPDHSGRHVLSAAVGSPGTELEFAL